MPSFIGFPELIVLVIVLLLIFGPKRLPEIGKSLGKGMREFKDSVTNSDKDEDEKPAALVTPPPPPATPEVVSATAVEHDNADQSA